MWGPALLITDDRIPLIMVPSGSTCSNIATVRSGDGALIRSPRTDGNPDGGFVDGSSDAVYTSASAREEAGE